MIESADRRVLGAFRCLDSVTGMPIDETLAVSSNTLLVRPNRSRVYVIFDAQGFTPLTAQFLPQVQTWPAPASFEVEVRDPRSKYLARRAMLQAPQKLGPATDPVAVQNPQAVTMFRSSSASTLPNWALVRVSVTRAGGDPAQALPWSVARITAAAGGAKVLATGMADERGQALVAVPGIGMQVSGNGGSVVQSQIDVSVDVWFDPAVLQQHAGWVPNPDDILSDLAAPRLKHAAQAAKLGAGTSLTMSFSIPI